MRYESSQVKALPVSRRRMMPPTPLQNSNDTFEEEQVRFVVDDQMWSARERTIIASTKQYLEFLRSINVEIEELEDLLGPDVDVDRILTEARDERGYEIFETFSSNDISFLVAERSRWDKYRRAPWRQESSASASDGWRREVQEHLKVSWSPIEKRVMDAVGDYLKSYAQVIVDIEVVERLLRPDIL